MTKKEFDTLMLKGWKTREYNYGGYSNANASRVCAVGAAYCGKGGDPRSSDIIDFAGELPPGMSRLIFEASDNAGNKKDAIKAILALEWKP